MLGQFFARKSIKKGDKQLYIIAGIVALDENDTSLENGEMILANLNKLGTLGNYRQKFMGHSIDGVLTNNSWIPFWEKLNLKNIFKDKEN